MYPIRVAIVSAGSPDAEKSQEYLEMAEWMINQLNQEQIEVAGTSLWKFDAVVVGKADEALVGHLRHLNYTRILVFLSTQLRDHANVLARADRTGLKIRIISDHRSTDGSVLPISNLSSLIE